MPQEQGEQMDKTEILQLLNNGNEEELIALPGIGPVLGERLVAARPFTSFEEVQAVKGINTHFIERLSEFELDANKQTVEHTAGEPALEPEPGVEVPTEALPAELEEAIKEEEQASKDGDSELGKAARKRKEATSKSVEALPKISDQAVKPRGSLWSMIVSGTIAAIIAILLTLAILGGINGSLKFATSADYLTAQREVSQLSTQVDVFQQDLDDLRGRVDILEGLGDRTVALEDAQAQSAADLETASQQVTDLQSEIIAMNEKVTLQEERTLRFETFLEDLQTLLGNLFTPQGGN